MKSKIKRRGIVLDENKKLKEAELDYDEQSDDEVCGFGRLIAGDAANLMINAYHEQASKEMGSKFNKAVTLGKEAILNILSQKGCEGIRFYFGKRHTDFWEKGSKYSKFEGLTLIAVGVDADNNELSPVSENTKATTSLSKSSASASAIYEVMPPWP